MEVFFIKQELAFELGGKECVREEFYKGRYAHWVLFRWVVELLGCLTLVGDGQMKVWQPDKDDSGLS